MTFELPEVKADPEDVRYVLLAWHGLNDKYRSVHSVHSSCPSGCLEIPDSEVHPALKGLRDRIDFPLRFVRSTQGIS